LNVDSLKAAAAGRWPEILSAVCGLDLSILDGKHHPCPKCGGVDRFRLIDEAAGALFCNQCFATGNGDGLAAIQWYRSCDFLEACDSVSKHLRLTERPQVVASFYYYDEAGELLYVVERWEPGQKGKLEGLSSARSPDGSYSTKGIRRILYLLPELVRADPAEFVFIPGRAKSIATP
jgi:hypothetical protein